MMILQVKLTVSSWTLTKCRGLRVASESHWCQPVRVNVLGNTACITGTLWAKRGERGILLVSRYARNCPVRLAWLIKRLLCRLSVTTNYQTKDKIPKKYTFYLHHAHAWYIVFTSATMIISCNKKKNLHAKLVQSRQKFLVHQHGRRVIVLYTNMASVTSCENDLLRCNACDFM